MRVLVESHLHAATILEGDFPDAWADLQEVLVSLPVPLRSAGPYSPSGRPKTPKRQKVRIGGMNANLLLPVDQSAYNEAINDALLVKGWSRQPYVLVDLAGRPIDTRLRGDFEKQGVFVEVEFGNIASLYRDLFKFQIAGTSGAAHAGVLIVATGDLARFFDQGVATYQQAVALLPYMRAGLQLPTAILGIEVDDWVPIRDRYEEMRATAEANAEGCHAFDTVFTMPLPEVDADIDVEEPGQETLTAAGSMGTATLPD